MPDVGKIEEEKGRLGEADMVRRVGKARGKYLIWDLGLRVLD